MKATTKGAPLHAKPTARQARVRRPNLGRNAPKSLLDLQRLAGNAAVSRLVSGADQLSAQRFPFGPFTPRGAPPGSSAPLPASDEVVELRGKPRFAPSVMLQEHIKAQGGAPVYVRVQFGSLAEGQIPVLCSGTGFETTPPLPNYPAWGLPFDHPAMRTWKQVP